MSPIEREAWLRARAGRWLGALWALALVVSMLGCVIGLVGGPADLFASSPGEPMCTWTPEGERCPPGWSPAERQSQRDRLGVGIVLLMLGLPVALVLSTLLGFVYVWVHADAWDERRRQSISTF